MARLFSDVKLGRQGLLNRIVVAPMCQYSARDGVVGDWHLMHVGQFAISGAGLFIAEATAVSPEGRISTGCPGLWSDEQAEAWARITKFARDYGHAKMGMQLAHAGRKASTSVPWEGGKPIPQSDGGWPTVSASAQPFADGWPQPQALDEAGLQKVIADFKAAAMRAERAGFDVLEIHAAHGYLLHQFLSPLSNTRDDAYGGALKNRMRLVLEVFDAVREAVSQEIAVGIRISASDWIEGGWDIQQSIALSKALDERGCDFVHVSSGGLDPRQDIATAPGYQVGFASAIKGEVSMPVIAVGLIDDAQQAEDILSAGHADLIALARPMLFNPHWAWAAAQELGAVAPYPRQYERAHPSLSGLAVPGNPPK